jgi:hypothetical protein
MVPLIGPALRDLAAASPAVKQRGLREGVDRGPPGGADGDRPGVRLRAQQIRPSSAVVEPFGYEGCQDPTLRNPIAVSQAWRTTRAGGGAAGRCHGATAASTGRARKASEVGIRIVATVSATAVPRIVR